MPSERQNQDRSEPGADGDAISGADRDAISGADRDAPPGEDRSHVWVLETQTKGTGANMVPLDKLLRKPGRSDSVPGFVFRRLERRPEEPEPPAPHRFRVVDVMTQELLADDVDARSAVQALERIRSVVDVLVYVHEPETERWRMLTFGETEALWGYRGRIGQVA